MDELRQNDCAGGANLDLPSDDLDYWQRPIKYFQNGPEPEFISFGRDGRPGGVGVNADISSTGYLTMRIPTPWQFALCFGPKFILVLVGIGIIGSKLYIREVKKQRQSGWSTIPHTRLIFLLVITSLLTGVACAILRIDKGQMISAMCVMSVPRSSPNPIQSTSE